MCAVPSKVIFCSSLMLIWLGILPRYVSSPFLIAPSAPMITGIVSVLIRVRALFQKRIPRTFLGFFQDSGTSQARDKLGGAFCSLLSNAPSKRNLSFSRTMKPAKRPVAGCFLHTFLLENEAQTSGKQYRAVTFY